MRLRILADLLRPHLPTLVLGLVLGLAAVFGIVLGRRTDDRSRRLSGIGVTAIVVVVAVAVSVFFYPLWTAQLEDWEFIRLHYWIPSWK